MPDFSAIAVALALRFDPINVTPPAGGYDNIRYSTPFLAEFLGPLPVVLVFPDSGTFETGQGDRQSVHTWTVRFYYSQGTDLARESAALLKWATVLVDQLKTAVSLSTNVTRATVDEYTIGVLGYDTEKYTGIELKVGMLIAEGWLASG